MALNSFDLNDACGVICKQCVKKENLLASNVGASFSEPNHVQCSQLNVSSSSENFTGEEVLTDPEMVALMNNDPLPGNVANGGSVNPSQLPYSGRTFMFEKKLTATDCNPVTGRLLLPKQYAEEYFPMRPGQTKMPVAINDQEGQTWYLILRWWAHKKSRKYVLDGTRTCIQRMNWTAGDTLKFFRQLPENEIVMELQKDQASTSS